MPITPVCEPPAGARFRFDGWVGGRLEANLNHWLLTAQVANPAILQMFRDRDRQPRRALVPWAGEFPGNTSSLRCWATVSAETAACVNCSSGS